MNDFSVEDLELDENSISVYPVDNINVLVASLNIEWLNWLRKHFAIMVKNAKFQPSVKSGNWDGKLRFMKANGLLPRGLVGELIEEVNRWKADNIDVYVKLLGDLKPKEIDLSNFEAIIQRELVDKQTIKMPPWDHQITTAKELIKNRRCVARNATSSGKSYTMAMIITYLQAIGYCKKALIIVPRVDLTVQIQQNFSKEFGVPLDNIGLYFGAVKDGSKPITVSTWQSGMNIEDEEFFKQFDLVIADECFTGDTLIRTSGGFKKIKDITIGDKVLSYNFKNKKIEEKEVLNIFKNRTKSNKLIKITLENDKVIKCTPNHLFYTKNRGWVKACQLLESDDF